MNLSIKIDAKYFYSIIIIIAIFGISSVVAYDPNFEGGTGEPPIFGHSSDEVNVNINGQVVTLQQAIDQGLLGGGSNLQFITGKINVEGWVDTNGIWGTRYLDPATGQNVNGGLGNSITITKEWVQTVHGVSVDRFVGAFASPAASGISWLSPDSTGVTITGEVAAVTNDSINIVLTVIPSWQGFVNTFISENAEIGYLIIAEVGGSGGGGAPGGLVTGANQEFIKGTLKWRADNDPTFGGVWKRFFSYETLNGSATAGEFNLPYPDSPITITLGDINSNLSTDYTKILGAVTFPTRRISQSLQFDFSEVLITVSPYQVIFEPGSNCCWETGDFITHDFLILLEKPNGAGGGGNPGGGLGTYTGATSGFYDGIGVGGYDGGDAKCNTQFSGSRMCTAADFANGRPDTDGWYNGFYFASINPALGEADNDCNAWTANELQKKGPYFSGDAVFPFNTFTSMSCSATKKILCCMP